jgi:hypothetical protein
MGVCKHLVSLAFKVPSACRTPSKKHFKLPDKAGEPPTPAIFARCKTDRLDERLQAQKKVREMAKRPRW